MSRTTPSSGRGASPTKACMTRAKEEDITASLSLRLAHLEAAAATQYKKLAALRNELTGEDAVGYNKSGATNMSIRVEALEYGLKERAATIEELLIATKRATKKLQ